MIILKQHIVEGLNELEISNTNTLTIKIGSKRIYQIQFFAKWHRIVYNRRKFL